MNASLFHLQVFQILWSTFTSVTTRKKVNRKFCSHNIFHPGMVLKGLRQCHNNILKTI